MQSIKDIKIKLKKDLENQQGTISISLSNISIDIHGKDIIGNAIQDKKKLIFIIQKTGALPLQIV